MIQNLYLLPIRVGQLITALQSKGEIVLLSQIT